MGDQTPRGPTRRLTRRNYLATGLAVLGGSVLAGCLGGSDGDSSAATTATSIAETTAPTAATDASTTNTTSATSVGTVTTDPNTADATGTRTGSDATTAGDGSYAVTMAPMGEVEFESVPEQVFTVLTSHAGMAVALGRGENITAVYSVEYSNSLLNAFTPRLDGVSVDLTDCYASWNPSKEKLYDLADPANVLTMDSWEQSDIEEVAENVAPWVGNTFSADHTAPPDTYAETYEYYTLWETFEHVAEVFRERERYEALLAERDAMLSTIEDGLPAESERPTIAMVLPSTSDDSMWTYDVNAAGYHASHTRPLGAIDAFGNAVENGDQIDYEALLEADPGVILVIGGLVETHDMPAIRQSLADDPVAAEVTAVANDRVYAQGTRHQGPLVNLFQIEMGAKQLYPDQFGAWPAYEGGAVSRDIGGRAPVRSRSSRGRHHWRDH